MQDKLKFDSKRHDNRVTTSNEEQNRAKVMKIVRTEYDTWKRSFRKKEGMPVEEVKDKLLELRTMVSKHVVKEGLAEWVDFSTKLIDEKLAEIDTVLISHRNKITRYNPNLTAQAALDTSWTDAQQFQTEQEFHEIPWVKSVMEKPGFFGFVLDGSKVLAMFEDGESVPVGVVSCGIGLERIPSIKDWEAALAAAEAESKAADQRRGL